MKFKNLKPANEKLLVHNPATKTRLPDEGMRVAMTPYWNRRLKGKEVVEIAEIKKVVKTEKKIPKKS